MTTPKKLSFRVSGARLGTLVRPIETDTVAPLVQPIVHPLLRQPRFGLRVHTSPLAPPPAITADDYATAEDYE